MARMWIGRQCGLHQRVEHDAQALGIDGAMQSNSRTRAPWKSISMISDADATRADGGPVNWDRTVTGSSAPGDCEQALRAPCRPIQRRSRFALIRCAMAVAATEVPGIRHWRTSSALKSSA